MAGVVPGEDQLAAAGYRALHAVDQIADIDAGRGEGLHRHGVFFLHEVHAADGIDGADHADGHFAVALNGLTDGDSDVAAGYGDFHHGHQHVAILQGGRRAAAADDDVRVIMAGDDDIRLDFAVHRIAQVAALTEDFFMQRPGFVHHLD